MKCDYCNQPAIQMAGETNSVLVCNNHAPNARTDFGRLETYVAEYVNDSPTALRVRLTEAQWNALEMARKVEQAERRAEDAEAEVERLRSLLAKVQRVFDLQCPPMLPSKYDDRGAWMAHAWWDKVLGPVLQQVTACEWCAQQDGHANGCRLGRGPDEGECEHHWLDRPESDSRECLICGDEVFG